MASSRTIPRPNNSSYLPKLTATQKRKFYTLGYTAFSIESLYMMPLLFPPNKLRKLASFMILFLLIPCLFTIVYAQTPKTITVEDVDYSFQLEYSLSNGDIESIDADPDAQSLYLVVDVSETDDGELIITLPRELIDSKTDDGADDDFLVFVDFDETSYTEIARSGTERQLRIPIPAGTFDAEIVGTEVIPEFPALIVMTLALVIPTASIVVLRKFGLSYPFL